VQTEKTVDSCFMLPVLPHKIGNVRDFWDDVSEKFGSDAGDLLKGAGMKRMLAFLQTMPERGDFMIMFIQSTDNLAGTVRKMLGERAECSQYLKEQFKDFTGMDISSEENMPKLELLSDWADSCEYVEEKDMLKMAWCFAVPVKQGMTDELLKYAGESDWSTMGMMEKLLREHDIRRRMSYLQRTPQGDFIVVHLLASNPLDDIILDIASCDSDVCRALKHDMMRFIDVDLMEQKNLPNVNLLFKWDEARGFETAEQTIAYTE
jgi:hypothetical protein